MKSVIITGCAGFIGSHVTEEFLTAGYKVIGIDNLTYAGKNRNMSDFILNDNFIFNHMDINDTENIKRIVEEHDTEWIINLAAETHVDNSIKNDEEFIRTNINGTRSLLNVCRNTGVKLLHFSTDEVYGVADETPFAEDSHLRPSNPYSATKASADHMIESYANTYGTEYIIVRPSNNFGQRQDNEKFMPTIIRKLKSNQKIPVYGDRNQIREWTYVKDTVKATRFILENSSVNEIYNIGSEFYLKNIDLVNRVCNYMDKDFEECVEFIEDRPGHDFKYSITSKKLNTLGFKMEINFAVPMEINFFCEFFKMEIRILLFSGVFEWGSER